MRRRCYQTNHHNFPHYGGRGITVCERWCGEQGFENFLADTGPRPEGMTLDRIDNALGYFKENCRWSSASEQARNRRCVVLSLEKAREIRLLAAEGGMGQREIANKFGTEQSTVSQIVRNVRWKEAA